MLKTLRLTEQVIEAAKPNRKKITKLYDGQGLVLFVQPDGAKWWRFRYRFRGKERMISLGVYPDISLRVARNRRAEAHAMVVADIDPSSVRRYQKEKIAVGPLGKSRQSNLKLKKAHRVDVMWINDSPGFALVVPDTNGQIAVMDGRGFGPCDWAFVATNSGVEIHVYDERPNRGPCPSSGKKESEHPYFSFGLSAAFRDGLEIYDAAVHAGIPMHSGDAAEVRTALQSVTFVVIQGNEIFCRAGGGPRRKKRPVTQKIIDGGEDMTV